MKNSIRGLLACIAAAVSVAGQAQASDREYDLDLNRSSVRTILVEFSRQTGLQVGLFPDESPGESMTAGPLRGHYTANEALSKLLGGTGLVFRQTNERTITVLAAQTAPVARAVDRISDDGVGSSSAKPEFVRLVDQRFLGQPGTSATTLLASDQQLAAQTENSEATRGRTRVRDLRDLEEIIVTAQKRSERLQDVPISMGVVTADDIDRRSLVNAADYLRGIPGVNQMDAPFGQSIVIRGLETSPSFQNFSAGTTVATYFGETPTTNSSGLGGGTNIDLKLVDIERVEILRGPQGTAFGSSSLGGVVRTIPVAPKLDHFEGRMAAGYSATSGTGGNNFDMQAIVNAPLITDELGIRATAYKYHDSGFYRNRAGSDLALRDAVIIPFGLEAFAVDQEEVGSHDVVGGRIAGLFQPSDALKITLSYLTQKAETDGYELQNSGTYEQTLLQVAPSQVIRGQRGGVSDSDIDIWNAMLEYDFTWANVVATYSHVRGESQYVQPGGYNGLAPFSEAFGGTSSTGDSHNREHVGELRLTTRLDGQWNFIAGVYAENVDDEYVADSLWFGSLESNPFGTDSNLGHYHEKRILKQRSVFTEASWKFAPDFTLTGGVRAYHFDRTQHRDSDGPFYGPTDTTESTDASGTSFRGNLSYKPSDNALVYVGWAQGFRLGKPQAGLTPVTCDVNNDGIVDGTNTTLESTRSIDSDKVESYDLGGKFTLLNRRLLLAMDVYRVNWTGVPVSVFAPPAPDGCGSSYTANAGDARSQGIELQANFYVTEAFRVDVGGSTIDAELTKDAPGIPAFDGDRLPGSPKFNANLGFQYEFDIQGYGVSLRADSIYVGPFYGNLQQQPETRSGDYIKVDASTRVAVGNLNIDLYVRNLTNADDFAFRDTSPLVESFGYRLRPRTIGMQLGYTF
jgi:outer membrane receptor protein involved in Fe transport